MASGNSYSLKGSDPKEPPLASNENVIRDSQFSGDIAFDAGKFHEFLVRTIQGATPARLLRKPETGDNQSMETPINRAELDAKLATAAVTLDRRIDGLDSKLEGIKGELASTKSTVMWGVALVIGTIVATAALLVSSFDSGRETAKLAAETQRSVDATLNDMKKIVQELRASQVPAQVPPPATTAPPADTPPAPQPAK